MAEILETLPEFAGFAVSYDPSANPFFKPIVVETLRKINSVPVGKTLLAGIQAARPQSRGDFPPSINVILKPLPSGMQYNQSGTKPVKQWGDGGSFKVTGMATSAAAGHNLTLTNADGTTTPCPFWKDGTSANEAVDQTATGGGRGTVCRVTFSNAQFMTSKGEPCSPIIVLAHELIHSLHCLQGVHAGDKEELWTAGEGVYSEEPMSEAAFRRAYGLPPRAAYY
ncbi:MAG TPA: M91 family zinc metallopeptidase [Caulobacteraceae bacterium]